MSDTSLALTRRQFSGSLAALGMAATVGSAKTSFGAAQQTEPVSFFFVSDTHYLAVKDSPGEVLPASAEVTGRLIETLNRLPGEAIPESAGGGQVRAPQGVLHGGDLIDTGDKQGAVQRKMQETEWAAFTKDFGLSGKDGKLKYPVYEVHGNHDGPQGVGVAIDGIKERNKARPGVKSMSENGLHYSWDFGPVHFVNLGIVVGLSSDQPRKRRYDPHNSLEFLTADLKQHVGESRRPVVLTHHVDLARYAVACDVAAPFSSQEWDPCDVAAYYKTIAEYNIAGIFYGHTHVRKAFNWDGASVQAKQGIGVFNVDNGAHFNSATQGIFYVELSERELLVREYLTKDRWQSGEWTAEVWRKPLAKA